ncbi:hypothetical protein AK830_g8357 [Neonectria ditissima]|uniref:Riboflavin kinase n=1 Tax=Neonectria ditissima TaxID=78410 RepID=A0A0P7AKL7_9HYPO|nr:hypothetical protein AK830_g8357 [Neonectria ditissima]
MEKQSDWAARYQPSPPSPPPPPYTPYEDASNIYIYDGPSSLAPQPQPHPHSPQPQLHSPSHPQPFPARRPLRPARSATNLAGPYARDGPGEGSGYFDSVGSLQVDPVVESPRPGSSLSPQPAPARRPLRPVRSATNLTGAHPRERSGFVDGTGNLQVDFVVDPLPRQGSSLSPQPANEIRRVKSSSALSAIIAQDDKPKDQSKWKAALGEAQYFAGGLISHPAESNKHFTIIRHSHALVWYRGPATSVPISILSDAPLPSNRTVWLQQKGFSGNVGMSLKALMGTTGGWINVTPATKAAPEHIPENEERSIQRDLKRFFKKVSGKARNHVLRETHIVRIPAAATDGYFRLVLSDGDEGKKALCGSPVFRIASTSTDVSAVRGSSLSTLPLEFGVKVATTIGQQVVKKYTGVAGAVAQSSAKRLIPKETIRKAATKAYHNSGIGEKVTESWKNGKTGRYDPMLGGAMLDGPLTVVGPETGPEAPFPLKFSGKVVRGTGISVRDLGIPTANLSEVPDEFKMRMAGVFVAWACIQPKPGLEEIAGDWYEALVTIAPLRNAAPGVVQRNKVAVHIINDFEDVAFFDARLKVILMGYLHSHAPGHSDEDLVEEHEQDIMTALATLGRPNWEPHDAVTSVKIMRSERSFSDRLDEVTGKVQNGVDRFPVHWAGVRSESSAVRDQVYGNGGLWIAR